MDGAGDIACFGRSTHTTNCVGCWFASSQEATHKMRSLEERAFSAIGGDLMMYDDRDELAILGA